MAYQINCDRCRAVSIDQHYWLSVAVKEELPRDGGVVTDFEIRKRLHFCAKCKAEILKPLMNLLKRSETGANSQE